MKSISGKKHWLSVFFHMFCPLEVRSRVNIRTVRPSMSRVNTPGKAKRAKMGTGCGQTPSTETERGILTLWLIGLYCDPFFRILCHQLTWDLGLWKSMEHVVGLQWATILHHHEHNRTPHAKPWICDLCIVLLESSCNWAMSSDLADSLLMMSLLLWLIWLGHWNVKVIWHHLNVLMEIQTSDCHFPATGVAISGKLELNFKA
jgi:hypothetical protein